MLDGVNSLLFDVGWVVGWLLGGVITVLAWFVRSLVQCLVALLVEPLGVGRGWLNACLVGRCWLVISGCSCFTDWWVHHYLGCW